MFDVEAVPNEVQELLRLFETDLVGIRFPDLDSNVLKEAVERVRDRQGNLTQAEAVVQVAKLSLEAEREELLRKASRALAYLRIYAESDPLLSDKLAGFALSKPSRKPARVEEGTEPAVPKRRGRPAKNSGAASLFSEAASEAASGQPETEGEATASAA